jgi:hypothetical protein
MNPLHSCPPPLPTLTPGSSHDDSILGGAHRHVTSLPPRSTTTTTTSLPSRNDETRSNDQLEIQAGGWENDGDGSVIPALALGHLQDLIYYAYTFYTGLLEEQTLRTFRTGWIEVIGGLAHYRLALPPPPSLPPRVTRIMVE